MSDRTELERLGKKYFPLINPRFLSKRWFQLKWLKYKWKFINFMRMYINWRYPD